MARKTVYILIGALVLAVAGFFVIAEAFPKELNRFPIFVLILLLDLYLWVSIKKKVHSWNLLPKAIFIIVYWLPLVMVSAMGIVSIFYNLYSWSPHLTTIFGGIIFILYISKLFTILFFLIADAFSIAKHALRFVHHKKNKKPCPEKGNAINRGNFLKKLGLIGGGIVLSGMIIGAVRWAYDFRIRREYLRFPILPRQFDGLRIVQISDLHLGSWANKSALQEAMDAINDEHPDIICFTGDMVNFVSREAFRFQDELSSLKARYGIYAVLGNHDYGDYVKWTTRAEKEHNLRELERFYEDIGWKLLRNENELIGIHGTQFAVIGVENWSAYDRFPKYGDINKAMKGAEDARFKLLLSHDPTHWDSIISSKYPNIDITLSGHTHGFQFGVELKNFRWSPAQYMYKRWAGLYDNPSTDRPQYLYVNRGLGMIGYPGRIGILPEITVIEISS